MLKPTSFGRDRIQTRDFNVRKCERRSSSEPQTPRSFHLCSNKRNQQKEANQEKITSKNAARIANTKNPITKKNAKKTLKETEACFCFYVKKKKKRKKKRNLRQGEPDFEENRFFQICFEITQKCFAIVAHFGSLLFFKKI